MMLPLVMATMDITNYTDAHTITIYKGEGKIKISSINLIHIINIQQIENELLKIREHTVTDLRNSYLYHTLTHEIVQTLSALGTLTLSFKNRQARSINWIGSAWKYIAGNPDHADLVMIENNLNDLISNNNDQIIINNELQNRINNLTKVSNMLANSIKRDDSFNNEIATSLQNQVRLMKEEIVNVKYAIQWAKLNIINTLLLNEIEIAEVRNIFHKGNLTFLSVEEMLEFVDVSVLHNKTSIIYIVKIPELETTTYKNLLIKPVIKNHSIVQLESNEIFQHKEQMFKIPTNCKLANNLKICNKDKIVNLNKTKCIFKLVQGKESLCDFSNAEHIEEIEEIDKSIILLNNFNGNITNNNITQHLMGTYLVHFWNDKIYIKGREFNNKETTIMKPGIPLIQITPKLAERLQILSLKALETLHIKNTKHLNELATHSTANRIAIFTLICIIIIIIFTTKFFCRPKEKVILQIQEKAPQKLNNTIPMKTISQPKKIYPEFNNIPYF